jgi:hypothetical protein
MAFTGNFACDVFKVGMLDGIYNFSSTTTQIFKLALYTNAATLNQDTTAYTTTGETSGAGYTAGGNVLSILVNPTTGGSGDIAYLSFADSVWSSSTITARGALVYLANGTTNPAVCVLDFGSDKSTTGGTFTVQFPSATNTSAIIRIS